MNGTHVVVAVILGVERIIGWQLLDGNVDNHIRGDKVIFRVKDEGVWMRSRRKIDRGKAHPGWIISSIIKNATHHVNTCRDLVAVCIRSLANSIILRSCTSYRNSPAPSFCDCFTYKYFFIFLFLFEEINK